MYVTERCDGSLSDALGEAEDDGEEASGPGTGKDGERDGPGTGRCIIHGGRYLCRMPYAPISLLFYFKY